MLNTDLLRTIATPEEYITGTIQDLPANTGLQRRFIDYIRGGGTFGNAYGILLYDGESDSILNR